MLSLDKSASLSKLSNVGSLLAQLILILTGLGSLVAQESHAQLKDVCPEGWSRYNCRLGPRLCVSPAAERAFEKQEQRSSADRMAGLGCPASDIVVPQEWIHNSLYDVGFANEASAYMWGYLWFSEVLNLDSLDSEYLQKLNETSRMFGTSREWQKGAFGYDDLLGPGHMYREPLYQNETLDKFGLSRPKPPSAMDVCPTGWNRYSCQFVRLCVSPAVLHHYSPTQSDEFKYARCKSDTSNVPEAWTGATPHDAGYAEGALLLGPRYLDTVKIDSSDVLNDDLNEAIQRLVMVPISAKMYVEYLHGLKEGMTEFDQFLAKSQDKVRKSSRTTKQ